MPICSDSAPIFSSTSIFEKRMRDASESYVEDRKILSISATFFMYFGTTTLWSPLLYRCMNPPKHFDRHRFYRKQLLTRVYSF